MTINPVTDVLLDLGAAWRPDWDRDELSQAVVAAKLARWSPCRTLQAVVQLICDPKGFPHQLKAAAAHPFDRTEPADPDVAAAALAEMREAVQHAGGTQ